MSTVQKVLVHNGAIYCSGRPDYTWMLFNPDTGYIEKVGRGQLPDNLKSSSTLIDCEGRRVLPGLQDSHLHPSLLGKQSMSVRLEGSRSIEDFQTRLRDHIKAHPDRTSYHGSGWDQDLLGCFPTKDDLDQVCKDKPVMLVRRCSHIAVANSKRLEVFGISKDCTDPPGTTIDRYPEGHQNAGEPNGILREKLVVDFVLGPSGFSGRDDTLECIRIALDSCLQNGVTCMHGLDASIWPLYCELADKGELPMRVIYVDFFNKDDIQELPRPGATHGKLLSSDRVKLFADGSLGGSTAALSKPYNGTNNTGVFINTQEKLNAQVAKANGLGYRLEIHAIGDAAVDSVLTAFEESGVAPEKRPIIVHCQIMRPDLIEKMKRQGAIASIQPQFVPSDAAWAVKCLPKELLDCSYPWKTLLETGVHCCGGSDAPIETPAPLIGMYNAVFRPDEPRDSDKGTVFRPEEKLTIEQAIDLYICCHERALPRTATSRIFGRFCHPGLTEGCCETSRVSAGGEGVTGVD